MSGSHARCGRFLPGTPLAERFWAKVDRGDESGCWLWVGARNRDGYGHISIDATKRATASRVAWELHNGPIPSGMLVCHHCDMPPCVRPDHLFLGTPADNSHDRDRKGRQGASPQAKLTQAQVSELRMRRASGEKLKDLAQTFGVHWTTVWRAVHHRSYK